MRHSFIVYFSLLVFFFSSISIAQIDNRALETPLIIDSDSLAKKLSFNANLFCYLKNNEYFNPSMDGFTLFGYWANPKLHYQPNQKVSIEAGTFTARNFGNSGFDTLMPTMTLRIKEKNWNFLFGNLEGAYSHKLIEPLYNFEKGIKKPVEQGFQAKYVKDKTFLDVWIDWQLFTKPRKNSQEHISGGLSYLHKPIEIGKIDIVFPVQFGVYHMGGQNVPIKLPVRTLFNMAVGNSLSIQLTENKKLILDNYFLGYSEDSLKGSSYFANLRFQSRKIQAIISYWNSYKFESPQGGDLYPSTSRMLGSNYYTNVRNIMIFRFIYNTKITEQLDLSIRVEPFYDFKSKKIEHSEGLYLVYRIPNIGIF